MPAAKQTSEKNNARMVMDCETLLQTLLNGLQQGLLVCAPDGEILLHNKAAGLFLGTEGSVNKKSSLYNLCLQSPVEHALNLLRYREQTSGHGSGEPPDIEFINTTLDQKKFLRCRLNFLKCRDHRDRFMFFFEDVSAWYRPENLLFMKIDAFRKPMTNLRAAVENLTEHPEMSPVMRSAFENILVQESLSLTDALDSLDKDCNHLMQTQSHLIGLDSAVLFGFIGGRLLPETVAFTADPDGAVEVKVDSYGLLLVLNHLADKILQGKKPAALHCRAHSAEQFAYFDFSWSGTPMPATEVESLLQEKIDNSIGKVTIAAILYSMGGDMWSLPQDSSRSLLRLALPVARGAET